jgi:hypothetical protein
VKPKTSLRTFKQLIDGGLHVLCLLGKDATLCVSNGKSGKVETTGLYHWLYEAAGDINRASPFAPAKLRRRMGRCKAAAPRKPESVAVTPQSPLSYFARAPIP